MFGNRMSTLHPDACNGSADKAVRLAGTIGPRARQGGGERGYRGGCGAAGVKGEGGQDRRGKQGASGRDSGG